MPHPSNVAIVGMAHHWRKAPWGQPDWDLWCMNDMHEKMPSEQAALATGWFDLHLRSDSELNPRHTEWAKTKCAVPFYTLTEWDGYPTNRVLPVEELMGKYGDYMTSSVSWMLAYAMEYLADVWSCWRGDPSHHPQPTIGLWGVDMTWSNEYAAQRPSCEYLMGLAKGLGYRVMTASESDLLKTNKPYGLGDDGPLRAKLLSQLHETERQIAEIEGKQAQVEQYLHRLVGQRDTLKHLVATWVSPDPTAESV